GTAGPPTGTVNFMLGTTLLGTGTLTTIDGSDASASIQVRGSRLSLGPNSIVAVYSGDGNYAGSFSPTIIVTLLDTDTTFGPENVGTSSAQATVIYSFTTS